MHPNHQSLLLVLVACSFASEPKNCKNNKNFLSKTPIAQKEFTVKHLINTGMDTKFHICSNLGYSRPNYFWLRGVIIYMII